MGTNVEATGFPAKNQRPVQQGNENSSIGSNIEDEP